MCSGVHEFMGSGEAQQSSVLLVFPNDKAAFTDCDSGGDIASGVVFPDFLAGLHVDSIKIAITGTHEESLVNQDAGGFDFSAGRKCPDTFAGAAFDGVHLFVMSACDDKVIGDDSGGMEGHFSRRFVFPEELTFAPIHADDESGVSADVEQVADKCWRRDEEGFQRHVAEFFAVFQIDDSQMFVTPCKEGESVSDCGRAVDAVIGLEFPDFLALQVEAIQETVVRRQQEFVLVPGYAAGDFTAGGEYPTFLSGGSIQSVQNPIFIADINSVFGDQRRGFKAGCKFLRIRIFDGSILPELGAGFEIEAVKKSGEGRGVDMTIGNRDTRDPAIR